MAPLAAVLFAIAAGIGATMAVQRLRGVEQPAMGVALTHGGFAAVALVLYIIAVVSASSPPVAGWWAIGIFVVAALGGAVLFLGFHLRGRALSVPLVLGHGGAAVVGFVVLLFALFG